MSSRHIRRAALLAAGLALAACASTSMVESRKEPGAGPLRFKKVLAVAILNNESLRKDAEDALQATLRVQSLQSYKLFTLAELKDVEKVKERLRQDGFDGVVGLRVAANRQEVGWTTASYVPMDTFVGYPPTEMRADSVVRVEVKVYSIAEDKLMWSGISKTFNPTNVGQAVADIVAAAGKELRRQGLVKS
jgi:hypothetical protein